VPLVVQKYGGSSVADAERIKRVHHADRAYGAPRITAELNDPA